MDNHRRRRRRREQRDGDLSDSSDTPTESSARTSGRRRHRRHSISGNDDFSRNKPSRRDSSPSAASDTTIDLPPRFDNHGRRIPERGDDPLADRLNDFLGEGGPGGRWLNKIVGVFGGDDSDGGKGSSGRKRRK